MTDKVQKIREEIEKLFNHVKDSTFESDSGAFYYLKNLLDLIDSLQKEPLSKDLEEVAEEITKDKESAVKFLKNAGIMDENGNLAEPYRSEESVSEDLENVAKYYIPDESYHMIIESKEEGSGENVYDYVQMIDMFKAGANWKEQQMMAKAIDVVIGNEWGHPRCVLTQYDLELLGIRSKDRVKVILIKED